MDTLFARRIFAASIEFVSLLAPARALIVR